MDASVGGRDGGQAGMGGLDAEPNDSGGGRMDASVGDRDSGNAGMGGHSGMDGLDAGSTDSEDGGEDPSPMLDGTYQCRGVSSGGSCNEPLVDANYNGGNYVWTLELADGALTITSIGFDTSQLHCQGAVVDRVFSCTMAWRRAGRECSAGLWLRQSPDSSLSFSLYDSDVEHARCTR